MEQAEISAIATVKSPKYDAFPVELMVIKSIVFNFVGVEPPPKIPLVELEQAPKEFLAALKSPKSVAFPV